MDFKSRYEFDPKTDLLGKGGFSKVYRANDVLLERVVALKFFTANASDKYQVLSEIKKVIRFEHPNLCKYYDVAVLNSNNIVGEVERTEVGIMEYLDAGDFKTYIKKHPDTIDKLLVDILQGLSYLHRQGIVHRDLKPQNILIKMVDGEPVAKITDFGISKLLGKEDNNSSALMGTIEYMAPEQFNPRKYGVAGRITTNLDLWSFGLMVYDIFNDKPLFGSRSNGISAEQVMSNILNDVSMSKVDNLPGKYRNIVKKCLVKNAAERVQLAIELIPLFLEKDGTFGKSPIIPVLTPEKPVSEDVTQVVSLPPKPADETQVLFQPKDDDATEVILTVEQPDDATQVLDRPSTMDDATQVIMHRETDAETKVIDAPVADDHTTVITNDTDAQTEVINPKRDDDAEDEAATQVIERTADTGEETRVIELPSASEEETRVIHLAIDKEEEATAMIPTPVADSTEDTQVITAVPPVKVKEKPAGKRPAKQVETFAVGQEKTTDVILPKKGSGGNKKILIGVGAVALLAAVASIFIFSSGSEEKPEPEIKAPVVAALNIPEMVPVDGGDFKMGSDRPNASEEERPVHTVAVGSFSIGKYEVTIDQFRQFVNETGYKTDAEQGGWSTIFKDNKWSAPNSDKNAVNWRYDIAGNLVDSNIKNVPVVHVSWNDAMKYCEWLSAKQNAKYTLPSEEQWEYAAKGGKLGRSYLFSGGNDLNEVGWYGGNSGKKLHPVGEKKPNELGVFDMSGNVMEWCNSSFSRYASTSTQATSQSKDKILRGGSWFYEDEWCSASFRRWLPANMRGGAVGFRVCKAEN
jgi:formylglycine-generating enzyme required for sulfatase activity/serine/threonine protein kinase